MFARFLPPHSLQRDLRLVAIILTGLLLLAGALFSVHAAFVASLILSVAMAGASAYCWLLAHRIDQQSQFALQAINATSITDPNLQLVLEFRNIVERARARVQNEHGAHASQLSQLKLYQECVEHFDQALMIINDKQRLVFTNTYYQQLFNKENPSEDQNIETPLSMLAEIDLESAQPTGSTALDKNIKINDANFSLRLLSLPSQHKLAIWQEISTRIKAEDQLQRTIGKAIAGDFSGRIDLETMEGFLLGLGKGFNMLMDAIHEPLQEAVTIQQLLANGDLTHKLDGFYLGEFATVKKAINSSIDKLQEVVSSVNQVVEHVSQTLTEIHHYNSAIAVRTNEQSSALNKAAASLEEMTASVKQNSDHTAETNQLANKAHKQAELGKQLSARLRVSMKDINEASQKVVSISNVIDEIAFQTKLLALNASVEAARAGEHGRGFSVVAGEVQNLAKRSAEAAKEIKSLVLDTMNKIKTGSDFVNQTDEALSSILSDSELVNRLVKEISSAINEEYVGINQINQAVVDIQSIAEENNDTVNSVREISSIAKSQAENLSSLMTFFKTRQDQLQTPSENPSSVSPVNSPQAAVDDLSEDDFFV